MTDIKYTYCGDCANFADEDISGNGYCRFHNKLVYCECVSCMYYLNKKVIINKKVIMKLKEFIKKHYPNRRYEEWEELGLEPEWEEYFSDALENYTKKVCKKQKANCNDNLFRVDNLDWRQAANSILDAEQIKIEEI